ncbi:histone-lysine N-methyltransferase 2D-like [Pseudochaenichthys georgianus]|uniref:histone-lysine N-methyltransferase 2D-like n=1 Tax=Pseudochaenichthys georgianus TaxID=52239 RepID=UPI0039C267BA
MHLKRNGHLFVVLLIYTITTITEPVHSSSNPALHGERRSVLTTKGLGERINLDSKREKESRIFPFLNSEIQNKTGFKLQTNMESSLIGSIFKDRNKPKRSDPPNEECNEGEIELCTPGKFYIPGQFETNPVVGYHADSASVHAEDRSEVRGHSLSASKESWRKLKPVVDCGNDAMTLTVRWRRAVQLQLSRVNESSVPLNQPPPHCGYSVQNTWRDLSLIARYDACHVKHEEEGFVLPLLWRGTPAKMSCPTPQTQPWASGPSSLCCSLHGMTFTVQGPHAAEDIRVNVRGEWASLSVLEERCGYTVERRDAEIIIAAPFITCGITDEDGKHSLSFQMEENTYKVACPVSPPEELGPSHHPPRLQTGNIHESLESFPWAQPFILAPLNYPHPTHHHKYHPPDESSSTAELSLAPPVDSPPDDPHQFPAHFNIPTPQSSPENVENVHPVYPDPQETHMMGVSIKLRPAPSPVTDQDVAPSPQPSSHGFNSYYHYYHHPKVPLPDATQNPDPGPEEPGKQSFTNLPQNPRFLENSRFLQPVTEAAFLPISNLPTSAPHPPHPYPFPYHYFPPIASGEAKILPPLDPEMTPNLSEDQKSDTSVHPRSSQVYNEHNPFNPYYHYYHPEIPQPGPPQDPDLRPEEPLDLPQNPQFPQDSQQFRQPGTEAASLMSTVPPKTSTPSHPPHPYPFPFHYFPHIGPEEAQRLPSLDPETTPNLSEDQNSGTSFHPRSSDAEATSLTSSPPESLPEMDSPDVPYPPHPYPFPYFYFPHIALGEDKGLPPLDPEMTPNSSEDQKSDTSVHPRSSQVHNKRNPFNPYYDYFHHPEIPQPGPPQHPDSGPGVPGERSLTHFTQNPEFLERSHQFFQPAPEAASFPSSLPESPPKTSAHDALPPPHPYPFPYHYSMPIARGDVKRSAPPGPETGPDNSVHPYYHDQHLKIPLPGKPEDADPGPEEPGELSLTKLPQLLQSGPESATLTSSPPESPPKASAPDAPPPPHPYPFPYYYFPHIARGDVQRLPPRSLEANPDLSEDQKSVHPRSSKVHDEHNSFNPYHQYYDYNHLKIPQTGPTQDPDPQEWSQTNPPLSYEFPENSDVASFTSSPSESPLKSAPYPPYPSYPYPNPHYYFPHIAWGEPEAFVDPQEMHPAGNMNFEKASNSEPQLPSDLSGLDRAAEAGFPSMPQQLRSLNAHYVTHQQQVDAFGLPDEEVGKRMDGEMKDCASGQRLSLVVPDSVLDHSSEISPVRLRARCRSPPGDERLHEMNPPPPVLPPVSTVTVQLRIATDESFSSFHPEAHLPLSVIGGGSVYLQLSLQDPPAPPHLLLLLVHSCLAFTHTPYSSWRLVYDG